MAILETSFRKKTSYDEKLHLGIYPTIMNRLINRNIS